MVSKREGSEPKAAAGIKNTEERLPEWFSSAVYPLSTNHYSAMPKTPCPACKSDVKYPNDAEIGTTVTCPECDEVFTPPKLKKKVKKYKPEDEETYEVGRATSDLDEKEKSRKVAAAVYQANRRAREDAKPKHQPLFGGPEVVLLVFAGISTVALAVGFVVAKRAPNTGEGIAIVLVYAVGMLLFAARLARARSRLGG